MSMTSSDTRAELAGLAGRLTAEMKRVETMQPEITPGALADRIETFQVAAFALLVEARRELVGVTR